MFNLSDVVKATQSAAIACYDFIGKGQEKMADKAAVDAMRASFNLMNFSSKIVIGEGERDEAPMLYIGEKVGLLREREAEFDIAVDPLEGTTICAKAMPGSLSVLAISAKDSMLHAPDVYMDKIASYIAEKDQVIDLDERLDINLKNIAKFTKKDLSEVSVIILDRPRHEEIVARARETGCKVKLISDGDIAAVIEVAMKKADLYIGIGGAPEGVLAAAALKTLSGQFFGRLKFTRKEEKEKAIRLGIKDLDKKYSINELVKSDVIFCATGVTSGPLLNGVEKDENYIKTNSLILSSFDKTFIKINEHRLI